MSGTLLIDRIDTIELARVANPPSHLLDRVVMADLRDWVTAVRSDPEVRALIITGPEPGVFVPHYRIDEIVEGADALDQPTPYPLARASLAAVRGLSAVPAAAALIARSPAAGLLELLETHRTLAMLADAPQVVIAAIGGDAMGGGCELALACDIRVMGRGEHRIGLPEITIGIPPGAGGTQRLMAAVGPARARAMVLRGGTVGPQEALALGLVDVVSDDPVGEALAIAERVSAWNPAAVRAAKRAMRPAGMRRGLAREAAGFVATASAPAARAAMRRFVAQSRPEVGVTPWRDRTGL